MTTFTTEDRIIAEKDGSFTVNVNAGSVTSSPPHIVDSGASVMFKELTDQEIWAIWHLVDKEIDTWVLNETVVDFAKAILKKVNEK
jgi:hypothetical protein